MVKRASASVNVGTRTRTSAERELLICLLNCLLEIIQLGQDVIVELGSALSNGYSPSWARILVPKEAEMAGYLLQSVKHFEAAAAFQMLER